MLIILFVHSIILCKSSRLFLSLFLRFNSRGLRGCVAPAAAGLAAATGWTLRRAVAAPAGSAWCAACRLAGAPWLPASPPTDIARCIPSSSPSAEPLVSPSHSNPRISRGFGPSPADVVRGSSARVEPANTGTQTKQHKHTHTNTHT